MQYPPDSPSLSYVPPVSRLIQDHDLPPKLKSLLVPELQVYIDKPPGKGCGVIYVQITPCGKMYVGQHNHGKLGRSFATDRMNKIRKKGCPAIAEECKRVGMENVRSVIIAHAPEGTKLKHVAGDTNDLEKYFISSDGLDTMHPKGYNLVEGGKNGKATIESRYKMKKSHELRWQKMKLDEDKMKNVSQNIKSARTALLNDPIRAKAWKEKLSAQLRHSNAAIAKDPYKAKHRRDANSSTRSKSQLLKDARKWIPMLAKCDSDEECQLLLRSYEKKVKRRQIQTNRRNRVRIESGRN